MADFGFIGPSYNAPSIYVDAQECINFFPEIDPLKQPGSRGVVALYPTPGLSIQATLQTASPVRGMRTVSGGAQLVVVCGQYVYSLNATLTPVIIGQLITNTGNVGITDNGLNVYITDGANRYSWRISSPTYAIFNGSITGTTLTVTSMVSGTIVPGQALFGIGVNNETVIAANGTGSGGVGTYTLNITNSVIASRMNSTAVAAVVTASIATNVLTVTAVTSGVLYPGQTIQGAGVTVNTIINALGSGTVQSTSVAAGGTGYAVNDTVTIVGGTYTTAASYTVTAVSGSTVTALTQTNAGSYTSTPISPVTTQTSGSGSGLSLNVTFGTGTGGAGTYTLSGSQTVASETMYALNFTILPSSDGAFSGGGTVDIVDNYFIYNRPGTQQWAASSLLSPITPALSFSSKDGAPDNLVSIIVNDRQVYLLGEKTSEVWVDVGSFPFAFQRVPGSNSQYGIAAQFSMAKVGKSFAYLSQNDRGQGMVMMMNGYSPDRISNHAVENTLVGQIISDAVAYTYQMEGHEVYVISFPSINLTWAYDATTTMWYKWLYCDNTNTFSRHRSNCGAVFQGMNLVGDYANGNIYSLNLDVYTDNGQPIRRVRRAPHITTDLQRQYFEEFQIQFQPGVGTTSIGLNSNIYLPSPYIIKSGSNFLITNSQTYIIGGIPNRISPTSITDNPQAMLRWSNDGGSTWSNEHWVSIGKMGKYKNRAIWRRLGWARDRVFEVVVTDPVKMVIVSANLKASAGEN